MKTEWDKSWSLGIPVIDGQHRAFIEMLNEIECDEGGALDTEKAKGLLKKLMAYIQVHFQTEEDFMGVHFHSELAAHKDEHKRFASMVRGFSREIRAGNSEAVIEMRGKLKAWLKNHIMSFDIRYVSHAKSIAAEEKLFILFSDFNG